MLQGQLHNLSQENARINARMKQIQVTNNSMNTRNKELTQQQQTSNIKIDRLQAEASDLRNSMGWGQSSENRHAEILLCLRVQHSPLCRENHQHSVEIERWNSSLQEVEMETARIQSLWEDAQNTLNRELFCRRNVSNRCRVRRYYSISYRTHRRKTHLRLLFEISPSRAQFLH